MSTAESILALVARSGFVTLDTLKKRLPVKDGTLIKALHQLQSEGLLSREERRGQFIYTQRET